MAIYTLSLIIPASLIIHLYDYYSTGLPELSRGKRCFFSANFKEQHKPSTQISSRSSYLMFRGCRSTVSKCSIYPESLIQICHSKVQILAKAYGYTHRRLF